MIEFETAIRIDRLVAEVFAFLSDFENISKWNKIRFTLDDEHGTTRVRDDWKLDTGRSALLEWLGMRTVKSAVAENLAKLKELLEEGQVVLQDGRQVTL